MQNAQSITINPMMQAFIHINDSCCSRYEKSVVQMTSNCIPQTETTERIPEVHEFNAAVDHISSSVSLAFYRRKAIKLTPLVL